MHPKQGHNTGRGGGPKLEADPFGALLLDQEGPWDRRGVAPYHGGGAIAVSGFQCYPKKTLIDTNNVIAVATVQT